jgi:hypothetical protein
MKTEILKFHGPTHSADGKELANHYHHRRAVERAYSGPFGRSMRAMLEGWARYADEYRDRFGGKVGSDVYGGEHWQAIGESLLALLSMDIGGFDAGSLNRNIRETLKANDCEAAE